MLHKTIKDARKRTGLTLTDAAEQLGVGKATLSRLENNKGPITATRLSELAAFYGVSAGALLDGKLDARDDGIDYDQLDSVVQFVVDVAQERSERLSPTKVATAVVELMRIIRSDSKNDPTRSFDPSRYRGIVSAVFLNT